MGADATQPLTNRPSGRLHLGSDQVDLVSGVATPIELDTITTGFVDAIENVGTYRITPVVPGLYLVNAGIYFESVVALKDYRMIVMLNADVILDRIVHSGNAANLTVCGSSLVFFDNDDFVRLEGVQTSGVNTVDVRAGREHTFLEIQRVR